MYDTKYDLNVFNIMFNVSIPQISMTHTYIKHVIRNLFFNLTFFYSGHLYALV